MPKRQRVADGAGPPPLQGCAAGQGVLFAGDSIAAEAATVTPGSRCVAERGSYLRDVAEQLRSAPAEAPGPRVVIVCSGANDGAAMLEEAQKAAATIRQVAAERFANASLVFLRPGFSAANGCELVSHETAALLEEFGTVKDIEGAPEEGYSLGRAPRRRTAAASANDSRPLNRCTTCRR